MYSCCSQAGSIGSFQFAPFFGIGNNFRSRGRISVCLSFLSLTGQVCCMKPCLLKNGCCMQDVRKVIPEEPGMYEWGCLPPGERASSRAIVAFYLGKAGTNRRSSREHLLSRFITGYGTHSIPTSPVAIHCHLY